MPHDDNNTELAAKLHEYLMLCQRLAEDIPSGLVPDFLAMALMEFEELQHETNISIIGGGQLTESELLEATLR